jgi:hypothetical protein
MKNPKNITTYFVRFSRTFVCASLTILLLISSLTISPPQNVLAETSMDEHLVVRYEFNDNTNDISGNGKNATAYSGPQASMDRFGERKNVYTFDGINDFIQATADIPERNFTISLWLKTSASNTGVLSIRSDRGGHDRHFYLHNGIPHHRVWQGGAWSVNNNVIINDGEWHHWVLTVEDNVGQKAYIDGSLAGQHAYDHSDFNWQNLITIGYSDDAVGKFFKGSLDDVRIYSKALSETEINEMCNSAAGTLSELLQHFENDLFYTKQEIDEKYGAGTGGSDSRIGTLTESKLCTSDGNKINCESETMSVGKFVYGTNAGDIYYNGGNVGIGTTAPSEKLEVAGTIKADNFVKSDGTEIGSSYANWNKSDGISIKESQIADLKNYLTTETDPAFAAWTKDYFDLTNKPDLSAFLKTETDPKIGTLIADKLCTSDGNKITCVTGPLNEGKFIDGTNSGDIYYDGGNVGIGTANPQAIIDIKDKTQSTSLNLLSLRGGNKVRANGDEVYQSFYLNDSGGTNQEAARITSAADDISWDLSKTSLKFAVKTMGSTSGDTELMTGMVIKGDRDGDGNNIVSIGIGTTNPSTKLDIQGTDPILRVKGNTSQSNAFLKLTGSDNGAGYIDFGTNDIDGSNWRITGNGYSPTWFGIQSRSEGNDEYRLVIAQDGNVGIGTTSPEGFLHLRGEHPQLYLEATDGGANKWFLMSNNDDAGMFHIGRGLAQMANADFTIKDSNVGIGTIDPKAKLHIFGDGSTQWLYRIEHNGITGKVLGLDVDNTNAYINYTGDLLFRSNSIEKIRFDKDGNVGIGTTNLGNYKLAVAGDVGIDGSITAKEIEMKPNIWADFVFKEDYDLKPLSEVEGYIQQYKHLPEVPSEAEVLEKGVSVNKMQALLLQKIEELTLYVIDLEKRDDALRKANEELKGRVAQLEKRFETLTDSLLMDNE